MQQASRPTPALYGSWRDELGHMPCAMSDLATMGGISKAETRESIGSACNCAESNANAYSSKAGEARIWQGRANGSRVGSLRGRVRRSQNGTGKQTCGARYSASPLSAPHARG